MLQKYKTEHSVCTKLALFQAFLKVSHSDNWFVFPFFNIFLFRVSFFNWSCQNKSKTGALWTICQQNCALWEPKIPKNRKEILRLNYWQMQFKDVHWFLSKHWSYSPTVHFAKKIANKKSAHVKIGQNVVQSIVHKLVAKLANKWLKMVIKCKNWQNIRFLLFHFSMVLTP